MFVDFVRQEPARCNHFAKYFQAEVDIDTTLQDDSGAETKQVRIQVKERAISWVAHQYPGKGPYRNSAQADIFSYEFVTLQDSVNGRKALVSIRSLSLSSIPFNHVTVLMAKDMERGCRWYDKRWQC